MASKTELRPPSGRQKACAVAIAVFALLYTAWSDEWYAYDRIFLALSMYVGFVAGLLYPQGSFVAALLGLALIIGLLSATLPGMLSYVLPWLPLVLSMVWLGAFA